MRLLLTRPRSNDTALEAALQANGHQIVAEPLLTLEFMPAGVIGAAHIQAVVATSSNALRAVDFDAALAALPLFAVGAATARTACERGFVNVVTGETGAQDLAAIVVSKLDPGNGSVLYLRGEDVAFDLAAQLSSAGFNVESRIVYRARSVQALSTSTVSELRRGAIGGVVLMSPRTSQVYVKLIHQADLLEPIKRLGHYCLSERVAEPLAGLGIGTIGVTARPNLQELVALIGRDATHSPA